MDEDEDEDVWICFILRTILAILIIILAMNFFIRRIKVCLKIIRPDQQETDVQRKRTKKIAGNTRNESPLKIKTTSADKVTVPETCKPVSRGMGTSYIGDIDIQTLFFKQLNERQRTDETLENENKKLKGEKHDLEEKIKGNEEYLRNISAQLQRENQTLQCKNETLKRENAEVRGSEKTAKAKAARQADRVKELERQAEDLRQQAEDAERRNRSLQEDMKDVHRRQRQSDVIGGEARRLRGDLEAAAARNDALQSEVNRLQQQAHCHEAELAANAEAAALRDQDRIVALERELNLMSRKGAENLASEKRAWEKERQELETAAVMLEEQRNRQQHDAEAAKGEASALRERVAALERERERTSASEAEKREAKRQAWEKERQELRTTVATLEERAGWRQREMDEVRQQLDVALAERERGLREEAAAEEEAARAAKETDQTHMKAAAFLYAANNHRLQQAFAAHLARQDLDEDPDAEHVDIDTVD